jgi:hypothetical protein
MTCWVRFCSWDLGSSLNWALYWVRNSYWACYHSLCCL